MAHANDGGYARKKPREGDGVYKDKQSADKQSNSDARDNRFVTHLTFYKIRAYGANKTASHVGLPSGSCRTLPEP